MTLYCFDAAYTPDLAKVKAAGGIAINGYLTGQYATTTTQPAAARAAGLGFVPTYEEWPSELVGATRATGQAVGRRILAAFGRLGIPLDGSIAVYPSLDVADYTPADCINAWAGIRDIIAGKISVRCYAEGAVIDALTNAHLVDGKCWLSASTGYPGYNPSDPNVCMVQLVGSPVAGTDANHLITDPHALGAWWPDGSPYGGTDVNLTDKLPNPNGGETTVQACLEAIAVIEKAVQTTLPALAKQVTALQAQVAALAAQNTPSGTVQVTGQLTLGGTA